MVMEAPPTPQCVGREFVRQYYTLLNKAPTHLHRFYNNQSSFVHGGLDAANRDTNPVIGQKQIHQKIQQLNFRDCHAKITQVDSQATLGNGVVVQVTGELSNAGQPMRRFTQTFVLAAQSPKKYYVHNDIFRYQDEIFTDEECDPESSRSEAEDEMGQEHPSLQDQQPTLPQQPIPYYANPNALQAAAAGTLPPAVVPPPHHHAAPPPQQQQLPPVLAPQQQPQVPTVNGAVHPEDLTNVIAAGGPVVPQSHMSAGQTQGISPHLAPLQAAGLAATVAAHGTSPLQPEDEPQSMEEPQGPPEVVAIDDGYGEQQDLEEVPAEGQEIETAIVSNEPKTYATLLKSGGNNATPNAYMSSVQVTQSTVTPQKPLTSSPPPQQNRFDQRDSQTPGSGSTPGNNIGMNQRNNTSVQRGNTRNNNLQRVTRQDSRGPPRNNFNEDDDRRRNLGGGGSQYGDSHQLFLGNLPHHATEEDLREIFGKFGTIMDLRIHSKGIAKGGATGGRIPPNYGFITYEDPQSVQNCLLAKPLYFPNNSENGQKLNVEEKKTRPRPSMDGGRPDNGGGGGRPGGNGPRPAVGVRSGGTGGGPMGGGRGGGRGGSFSRGGPPNRPGGQGQGGQNATNTYNSRR